MNFFTKIRTALKTRLHACFVYLVRATSDAPLVIEPTKTPVPTMWEDAGWAPVKEALLAGHDLGVNKDGSENKSKRDFLGIMLENVRKSLMPADLDTPPRGANMSQIIFPVVRGSVPRMIAWDIVGVAPMEGPVDQVFVLRSSYGSSKSAKDSGSIGIHILKETVEAKTRKLAARWTFEATQQDIFTQKGVDVEAEIMSALAQEITAEHDCEILRRLRELAKKNTLTVKMDYQNIMKTAQDMVFAIHRMSVAIGKRTHRGAGNWAVVSPTAMLLLKTHSEFAPAPEEIAKNQSGVMYAGLLNKGIKIYVDPWANENDPVLVGYLGNNMDTGVVFCPYVPLTPCGVAIDPQTFEPAVSFLTRYGWYEMLPSSTCTSQATDYYGLVKFSDQVKKPDAVEVEST
jgi:hypothetical protein